MGTNGHKPINEQEFRKMLLDGDVPLSLIVHITKEQVCDILMERYKHLEAVTIGQRDASNKYGVNYQTLAGWVQRGVLPAVKKGRGKGQQTFLNEQQVAVMVEMCNLYLEGRGGRVPGWGPPWLLGTPKKYGNIRKAS